MYTKGHYVYCLRKVRDDKGKRNPRRSYVGYTTDPRMRLRQHNGEIRGGARSTRGATWAFMFIVSGFPDACSALACEKRFHLLKTRDRARGITEVLSMARWKRTAKDDIVPGGFDLTLYCDPDQFAGFPLPQNVKTRTI
jgi:predicted GIY-YIG superfamily endonuclease